MCIIHVDHRSTQLYLAPRRASGLAVNGQRPHAVAGGGGGGGIPCHKLFWQASEQQNHDDASANCARRTAVVGKLMD